MEIFCVVLGWLLAQATTYINDVKKSQKRNSALLTILFKEFSDGVLQTKDILQDDSGYPPNSANFKHYALVTSETRNSLQQALTYWRQPLWKLLVLQLTHKKR